MKTRFYYTLAETMKLTEDETQFEAINTPWFMDAVEEEGQEVGGLGFYVNTILGQDLLNDDNYSKIVMKKYIWTMYYNEKVMYIDVEHNPWEVPTKPLVTSPEFIKERKILGGKIWSWVEESRFRYSKLAELYSSQIGNLLNQIKSSNISKFNDTPQADVAGGFAGDNYTTNITQNESSTDGTTIIARLDEIRRLLHSVYGEWAREFSAFTMEE